MSLRRTNEGCARAIVYETRLRSESLRSFPSLRLASRQRSAVVHLISHNSCSEVGKLNERRDRRHADPLSYEEEARVKQFSPRWLAILINRSGRNRIARCQGSAPVKVVGRISGPRSWIYSCARLQIAGRPSNGLAYELLQAIFAQLACDARSRLFALCFSKFSNC